MMLSLEDAPTLLLTVHRQSVTSQADIMFEFQNAFLRLALYIVKLLRESVKEEHLLEHMRSRIFTLEDRFSPKPEG